MIDGEQALEAAEVSSSRAPWLLTLLPDRLRLEPRLGGEAREVPRGETDRRVDVIDGLLVRRTVVVRLERRLTLRLEPAAFQAFVAWLGPPSPGRLRTELRRRLVWIVLVGILFLVAGASTGGVAGAVDLALGSSLLLTGLVALAVPHRVFFLLGALWFLALALLSVASTLGGGTWTWLLFALLQLGIARSEVKQFQRFGRLQPGTAGDPSPAPPPESPLLPRGPGPRHSPAGIASFALGLLVLLTGGVVFAVAGILLGAAPSSDVVSGTAASLLSAYLAAAALVGATGLALGLAGLRPRGHERSLAVAGAVLDGVIALAALALLLA